MAALLLLTATGCKDTLSNLFDGDAPDMQGEAIAFTSQLPAVQGTSQTRATANTELLNGYKAVNQNYDFTITMLKKEGDATGSTGKYKATTDTQNGVLSSVSNPLYWQDNVYQYGFKAEAGSDEVEKDQTTSEQWLKQDKLVGFGYEPLLGDDNADNLDACNYRTNKEWYQANKEWMNNSQSLVSDDEYKRIPLFLQHKRSLITVIVKAGEGVERKDVLAATASTKLDTHIYSYTSTAEGAVASTEVSPLQGSETVTYGKDVNGEAETSVVARYDAIVEPYDYVPASDDEEGPKICSINLSSQHFSFYASNDSRYGDYKELEDDAKQSSDFYQAYHLQAGDNLVITVTLSRDSRKILMTAYVQPWSDVVTSYVCDDFGTSGSTTVISEKQQLIDFLNNDKLNATGNVAILNTDSIKLDGEWDQKYNLNAILNMGNHTLTVSDRLFNKIASSGSLINGTLKVNKSSSDVKTLVCQSNEGTVDHLTLMNNDDDNRAVVTRAAVAETNYGYITNVSSRIKVEGKADAGEGTTYIGGIAGVSKSEDGTFIPSITGCTVDARVGIASEQTTVRGGGIVGAANGYVNGNTFEYGVTLSQTNVRNIVYANVSDNHDLSLMASDNEWPTDAENQVDGMEGKELDNAREDLYDAVLDCQEELKMLVNANSKYNQKGNSYRLSDSFSVLSQDDWELGKKNDLQTADSWGNVLFDLEGNNKTVTLGGTKTIAYSDTKDATESKSYTTAPMLFCNIMGTVKNLTLQCAESLYGVPQYGTSDENSSSDICAPLAYSVIGGTVENVDVRGVKKSDGTYPAVVAAIPAGLVVWANQNATITNCSSDMDVYMKVSGNYSPTADARLYAGGLIAQVAKATVTQCQYEPRTEYVFKCLKGNSDSYEGNANLVFGGIIGGTVIKTGSSSENPWVTITDCSSFYSFDADKVKFTEGSVLGRSIYVSDNNLSGVNKTACQGNWWPTGTKGVGDSADEKVIGKRNSVTPDRK